jgi:hypothetical protein
VADRLIIDLDDNATESRLGDGYRVDARIVVWNQDAVTVPVTALFRQAGSWGMERRRGREDSPDAAS